MSRLLTLREQKQYAKYNCAIVFKLFVDCFHYKEVDPGIRYMMEKNAKHKTLLGLVRIRDLYHESCKCNCDCAGKSRRCPECNPRNL